MSNWTPGPWTIEEGGQFYANINGVDRGWYALARVVVRMTEDWHDNPEGVANAHLIAAAPDLAEALEQIASTLDTESYPENGSVESRLGMIARAALRRAKGEA